MAPLLTLSAREFEAAIASLFSDINLESSTLRPFDESVLDKVRELLRSVSKAEWSKRPRIYTVLRLIDRPDAMDSFTLLGVIDMHIPYIGSQLPQALSTSSRTRFMHAQNVALSNAKDAEFSKRDVHLKSDADRCFSIIDQLGAGSFCIVDHVRSKLSGVSLRPRGPR